MQNSDDKWYGVRESDHFIQQVDLYKIHHMDNTAKATSLKMLEVNMRSDNVEDLPFPVGKKLTSSEIDTLLYYNQHDVKETLKFYYYSYEAIQLRKELSVTFGFDCTNFSDSKIGETLFINRLEQAKKGLCYTESKHGGRKINQTERPEGIKIKECLFDYLHFDRPEFKAVHDWLSSQTVMETKGVFNDYEEHQIGELAKYAQMKTKKVLLKNKLNLDNEGKPKADFNVVDVDHMLELEALKAEGMTLILVTHEMHFARDVGDRIVFMHQGKIWENGPSNQLFFNPKTPELQSFLCACSSLMVVE